METPLQAVLQALFLLALLHASFSVVLGPTSSSLPPGGASFTGSDGVTICRACSIDCQAWGFFTRCKTRYFNYGCHLGTACLRESEASVQEIQAATVMCAIWNGCQYVSDNMWRRPGDYETTTKTFSRNFADKNIETLLFTETIERQTGIDFVQLQNNLRRIILSKVYQVKARDYVLFKIQQNLRDLFLKNENKQDFIDQASVFYSDYLQVPQWLASKALIPAPYDLGVLFDLWKSDFSYKEPEELIWQHADDLMNLIIEEAGLTAMRQADNLETARVITLTNTQKVNIMALVNTRLLQSNTRVAAQEEGVGVADGEIPVWGDRKIHKMFGGTYYKKTLINPQQGQAITITAPEGHKLLSVGFSKTTSPLKALYPVDSKNWKIEFQQSITGKVELTLSVVEDPYNFYDIAVVQKTCTSDCILSVDISDKETIVVSGGAISRSKLTKSGPQFASLTEKVTGWFANGDVSSVYAMTLKVKKTNYPYFVQVRTQLYPTSNAFTSAGSGYRDVEESTTSGGSLADSTQTQIMQSNFVLGAQLKFQVNEVIQANVKLQWPDSLPKYANEEFGLFLNDIVACISCKFYRIKEHHQKAYGQPWQPKPSVLDYAPSLPTFYTGCGYTGEAFTLTTSILTLGASQWDNRVRSIKLPLGWRVQVFDDEEFSGPYQELSESESCLYPTNTDSKISSIKVYKKSFYSAIFTEQLPLLPIFFTEDDYQGYKLAVPGTMAEIKTKAASDYLPGIFRLLSCTQPNFGGDCQPIYTSAKALSYDTTLALKGLPKSVRVYRIVGGKYVEQTCSENVILRNKFSEPEALEHPIYRPSYSQTKLSFGTWFVSNGTAYTAGLPFHTRELVETFSPANAWSAATVNNNKVAVYSNYRINNCDTQIVGMYAQGYVWIPKFGKLILRVNTDDASWIFINGRLEASNPTYGVQVHDLTFHPFINRDGWNKVYVVGADWCNTGQVEITFEFVPVLPSIPAPADIPPNPLNVLTVSPWQTALGVTYKGLNRAPQSYVEVFTYSPPQNWVISNTNDVKVTVSNIPCGWTSTVGFYVYSWVWIPNLPGKVTLFLDTNDISWAFINDILVRNDECCGIREHDITDSKAIKKGAWNRVVGIGAEGCGSGVLGIRLTFQMQALLIPSGLSIPAAPSAEDADQLLMQKWYTSIGKTTNQGTGQRPTSAKDIQTLSPPQGWNLVSNITLEVSVSVQGDSRCNWINGVTGLYAVGFVYIPKETTAVTMQVSTDDISFTYINGALVAKYDCCGFRNKYLDLDSNYLVAGSWNLVQVTVADYCLGGYLGIKFSMMKQ